MLILQFMYEIIHGSVFYSDSFYGEVDFVERSFSKTFLKRFTFDFIITGNGYIEARELDPFLQELFDARYHVSIYYFLYRWQACGFEYSRQKCRNYGADISVTMVVIRGKLII